MYVLLTIQFPKTQNNVFSISIYITPLFNTPSKTLPGDFLCLHGQHFHSPAPLQYQIRPDEHFSSPATNLFTPVPNDHWFERHSEVNSHRLDLEFVTIQLVKSSRTRTVSSAEPFFCPFIAFAT